MDYRVYGVPLMQVNTKHNLYETITAQGNVLYHKRVPSFLNLQETRVIEIEKCNCTLDELKRRYRKMNTKEKDYIEEIQSEIDDDYSDDSLFNISSWGADLSFRELISMYEEDELVKPELQRKYVWDKVEASRFIESILLGLPVPSVFLAQSGSQKLIVDGYQRIMTVYDYMRGIFSTDKKVFRLSNSEKINARWRNKAFSELSTDDQRKIKSTTIHAIIFEQKKPENDGTSLYQVFERINTSGRTLTPQEIRNCVYQASVYKGYKRDKIEMRGDRAEMSDFPLYLNTVAGGLDCRNQAIGGFSFVVKIYALPVVEIIGQFLYLLGRYGFDAQIGYCF